MCDVWPIVLGKPMEDHLLERMRIPWKARMKNHWGLVCLSKYLQDPTSSYPSRGKNRAQPLHKRYNRFETSCTIGSTATLSNGIFPVSKVQMVGQATRFQWFQGLCKCRLHHCTASICMLMMGSKHLQKHRWTCFGLKKGHPHVGVPPCDPKKASVSTCFNRSLGSFFHSGSTLNTFFSPTALHTTWQLRLRSFPQKATKP